MLEYDFEYEITYEFVLDTKYFEANLLTAKLKSLT